MKPCSEAMLRCQSIIIMPEGRECIGSVEFAHRPTTVSPEFIKARRKEVEQVTEIGKSTVKIIGRLGMQKASWTDFKSAIYSQLCEITGIMACAVTVRCHFLQIG